MIKLVEYKVHICAIRVSLKTINLTSRLYDIYIYIYICIYLSQPITLMKILPELQILSMKSFGRSGKKKKENDCQFFIS